MKSTIPLKCVALAMATLLPRLVTAQNYPVTILADSPVGYWRLGEQFTPPASESATNLGSLAPAGDGAYLGTFTTGVPGVLANDPNTAVTFNGVNGKIDVPFNPALNNSAYTIECWAMATGGAGAYRAAVTSRDDTPAGNTRGFIFYAASNNRWEFWSGQGAGTGWNIISGPAVTLNSWVHLVGTYDGTTQYFYVNGTLIGGARVGFSNNAARPFRIGAGSTEAAGSFFFPGTVDEVAIYNGALSPDRVVEHYQQALGDLPAPVTPVITTQPVGYTNYVGASTTLFTLFSGTPPFQFQWRQNGEDLTLETNSSLPLIQGQADWSGDYDVVITTAGGSITSAPAAILFKPEEQPVILRQPVPSVVYQGYSARFTISATGGLNLSYQWLRDGADIPGANSATLVITNVSTADEADYSVLVGNANGDITDSDSARLTVITPVPGSYESLIVSSNPPIAYWRLGEPAGSLTAFDYVGGFNGTYSNALPGFPGAIVNDTNTAAGFDAVLDSRVYMSSPATFNFTGTRVFTLEAWVKFDAFAATAGRVFSNRKNVGGAGGYGFGVVSNNRLRFTSYGVVDADRTVGTLSTNQWYHLVLVRNANNVMMYTNGVSAGAAITVNNILTSPYPLQLGRNPDLGGGEEEITGTIDDAAVYGRALSATEVCQHYLAGRNIPFAAAISGGGGSVTVTWPRGALESATNVLGPWITLTNAGNSLTLPIDQKSRFFRVRK